MESSGAMLQLEQLSVNTNVSNPPITQGADLASIMAGLQGLTL